MKAGKAEGSSRGPVDAGGDLLLALCLEHPAISAIWDDWQKIDLPDCWLVAGCLAQTVWNRRFGLPHGHGIADLDLVYFDPHDLSEAGEQRQAERIRQAFPAVGLWIDVKNEARVHLWYEGKFGYPIRPYRSTVDAIDSFPTTATTIGMRPLPGGADVHCTFGTGDLFAGLVRPNKRQITRTIYHAKVSRWLALWPGLDVVPWGTD